MNSPLPPNLKEHEQQLVRSFFLPQRQERYLYLLATPRRRKDVLLELAHFRHLDLRWEVPTPSRYHNPRDLVRILEERNAPKMCWAVSEDNNLDGKELVLSEAIEEVLGRGMGTFLSCLPGRLAYFENEDGRWILERETER